MCEKVQILNLSLEESKIRQERLEVQLKEYVFRIEGMERERSQIKADAKQ